MYMRIQVNTIVTNAQHFIDVRRSGMRKAAIYTLFIQDHMHISYIIIIKF